MGKIKGVSVINAKFFPTYFERLAEDRMVAELWDGRERLEGVMRPLPGPHAQKAVKTAWMTRFYGNQEKWPGGNNGRSKLCPAYLPPFSYLIPSVVLATITGNAGISGVWIEPANPVELAQRYNFLAYSTAFMVFGGIFISL